MSLAEQEMLRALIAAAEGRGDDEWPSDDLDFWAWLKHPLGGQCIAYKDLGNGMYAGTKRLLFHYTMLIGIIDDRVGYDDRYCFQTLELAQSALATWDGTGDPIGWHRHPATGRRRPDGDPEREYIEH